MMRIAVVEDNEACRRDLTEQLRRYGEEFGKELLIAEYEDGLDLTEDYRGEQDVILLDIQMKHMDGMTAAKRIRERDRTVPIIFITNLAQYALEGYKVDAVDYLLKPVQYFALSQALHRAARKSARDSDSFLYLNQGGAMVRLNLSDIRYLESQGHNLIYHTDQGEYTERNTLKAMEQKLGVKDFARCNNCYLVNLARVEFADQNYVTVEGEKLQISRPKRKMFMEALADYAGKE